MTGEEHYAEAERLLASLPSHGINVATGFNRGEQLLAAQIHATLALSGPAMAVAGEDQGHVFYPEDDWSPGSYDVPR